MRQLLVASEVVVGYAGGVLASGAVDVQKRPADGSNSVTKLPADTIAQAPQIRLVQGTPEGKNIVTPWFSGTDVIAWKKATYVAGQVAQSTTLTFAGVPFVDVIRLLTSRRLSSSTHAFFGSADLWRGYKSRHLLVFQKL